MLVAFENTKMLINYIMSNTSEISPYLWYNKRCNEPKFRYCKAWYHTSNRYILRLQ